MEGAHGVMVGRAACNKYVLLNLYVVHHLDSVSMFATFFYHGLVQK